MRTLIFLICLTCFSVSAQSAFNSGFNDGYQSTLKDALIVRATPTPPLPPLSCSMEDYKCGYREGVKKAAVVISAKRNSGGSSSSNSNSNQQSDGNNNHVFDFSGIAEYGASLDQQPKKTYVRTSPTETNIKIDLMKGKSFKYVLMNDLYGNWPRRGIKANVKTAEKAGFMVLRDNSPVSRRYGMREKLPQDDIVVCKWIRTMKSTPLGGYTYDLENRYTIKLQTVSGEILYEAEYINSTYEEVWFNFSQYVR